jgi:phosphate/sulfate permease
VASDVVTAWVLTLPAAAAVAALAYAAASLLV